jgi:hypothetical protein
MPDDFSDDILMPDGTENPAIDAIWVAADDLNLSITVSGLYSLDQQAVTRLTKGNDISRRDRRKEKGDFANQYKIPFLEFRG